MLWRLQLRIHWWNWSPIEIRINEHHNTWIESPFGASLASDQNGHEFVPEKVILLHSSFDSFRKRIELENYEIFRHKISDGLERFILRLLLRLFQTIILYSLLINVRITANPRWVGLSLTASVLLDILNSQAPIWNSLLYIACYSYSLTLSNIQNWITLSH